MRAETSKERLWARLVKPYRPQALVELVRRWQPGHVENLGNA